jgi:hypothetical protein
MAEEFLPQLPEAGDVQAAAGIRVNQGEKLTENK